MTEGSWDNGGAPEPKKGLPTWAKVVLGCGCGCALVMVILIGSCVGIGGWISKHPEEFEKKVTGFVQDWAREDWGRFREAVAQLSTDEGARRLYDQNPGLKENYSTWEDFRAAVRRWRPYLSEVPADVPDPKQHHLIFNNNFGFKEIGFQDAKGNRIRMRYDKEGIRDFSVRKATAAETHAEPETEESQPEKAKEKE